MNPIIDPNFGIKDMYGIRDMYGINLDNGW